MKKPKANEFNPPPPTIVLDKAIHNRVRIITKQLQMTK
jgi:hypothetical protein